MDKFHVTFTVFWPAFQFIPFANNTYCYITRLLTGTKSRSSSIHSFILQRLYCRASKLFTSDWWPPKCVKAWYVLTDFMSGQGLLECTIKQQEDIWSTDVAVPSMYAFTGITHKAPALIFKSVCVCVCLCATDRGDARGKPRRLHPRRCDQWDRGESVQQTQVRTHNTTGVRWFQSCVYVRSTFHRRLSR